MTIQTPTLTERLVEVLAAHLWADRPNQTCGCGWLADSEWMTDRDAPNRVEQHLSHVAAELTHAVRQETRRPTPPVCTDPACTIVQKPGFPRHGPHDFRAAHSAPQKPHAGEPIG